MIKTLVSIEVDLAASRAIRFACQLGNFIEMEIHPVYIKEAPPQEMAIGAGWARRSWEKDMVEQGKAEISELLYSEIDYCPVLKESRVVYGDRETELTRVMEKEAFDFYVDGERFPWTPPMLYKKLHSRLLQRADVPIGLTRVLRKLEDLLVLCLDVPGTRAIAGHLQRLWAGCSLPVSLAVPGGADGALVQEASQAKTTLEGAGCRVALKEAFPYFPEPPGDEFLRQFGVVALALEKGLKKDNPALNWLCEVKVPLLLVLY
ncbi:MAG: hypothetical protein A2Z73_01405 [Deltaproteobacteria bacterium RBG_13_60_28]|nr:MAG: hypothetical protein A2Z73_01405 [Deltaproteobacteria bacterium RBG_13_60_28]